MSTKREPDRPICPGGPWRPAPISALPKETWACDRLGHMPGVDGTCDFCGEAS